jgi:hypothetical protein
LGGESAGAVTYGHGAEPAADEVHERDADADGGYGWGGDLGEEVGGDFCELVIGSLREGKT